MKKKSFFLSAGIILIIVSVIYIIWQQRNFSYDVYADYVILKEKQLLAYIDLGKSLDESNNINKLPDIFTKAVDNSLIDWYRLSLDGNPIYFYPEGTDKARLFEAHDYIYGDNNISYKTIELSDKSLLTIGINKMPEQYFKSTLRKYWKVFLQDIIVPVIFALAIFFYFFKDILNIIKKVSQREKVGHATQNLKSKEAQEIAQAVSGFEQKVDVLSYQNKVLFHQVLPSLRKEVLSGKKPPYEFNCTLVRTDINNFSNLFIQGDKAKLLDDVEGLFRLLAQIVSRYHGFIHEFIGDEVLFYFKDEDHDNSTAAALACLRDFEIEAKKDFSLTTKSSLSHGSLYFAKHLDGFNLSGAVFIETVRILSNIKEKADFSIHFSDNILSRMPPWASAESIGEHTLKGYNEKREIYKLSQFEKVNNYLNINEFNKNTKNLAAFKSIADQHEILLWIKDHFQDIDKSYLLNLLVNQKIFFLEGVSSDFINEIVTLINTCIEENHYRLAAAFIKKLAFYRYNLTQKKFIINLLGQYISNSGTTIQYESIKTASYLKRDQGFDIHFDKIKTNHNRALRWALIGTCLHQIEPSVVQKAIKLMQNSTQSKYGYYVAYHIVKIWSQRDILHLTTQAGTLLNLISNTHPNNSLMHKLALAEFNKIQVMLDKKQNSDENLSNKQKVS